MGEEYRGKVFKSGNSMALRLPKALGFAEGTEVRITDRGDGHLLVEALGAEHKIDVARVAGLWRGSNIILSEDRSFDDRPSGRADPRDEAA